jgi:ribosome maturation protein SDO1
MRQHFGTSNVADVAREILRRGEIQLTAAQRRQMLEAKKKKIVNLIARRAINPQTNTPHPPHRIEQALEEAKFNVDLTKSAEEQVPKAVKAIKHLLPIRIEEKKVAAKIPAQFTGKAYGVLKGMGEIKKEEWQKDGSLIVLVTLPAGVVEEFHRELSALTKGEVEIKVLE